MSADTESSTSTDLYQLADDIAAGWREVIDAVKDILDPTKRAEAGEWLHRQLSDQYLLQATALLGVSHEDDSRATPGPSA